MATRVISFNYVMSNAFGEELYNSTGHAPMAYMEGTGQLIPGLDAALREMKVGEKKRLEIPADQAFGEYNDEWQLQVPREQLPEGEISIGDQFQSAADAPPMVVTAITDTVVTLDANHPLAGVDLIFDLEVVDIREATADEISHGHVHGAGGHHH
jgi:FKBP-type peptidyl-prolyl cis-trans isomerase SlyD